MRRVGPTSQEIAVRRQIEAWLYDHFKDLETATKHGKPAVAGVQCQLVKQFPNIFDRDLKWRTYRQFVGRIICKIMLANEYERGHKAAITDGEFSSGMVYRE